jgi:flagellin-like hook-associated protein FlgL
MNSVNRLSSGSRLNDSGEDAAGTAVSLMLKNKITGTSVTRSNLENLSSFLEVQHSALLGLAEIYKKMDELRTQRNNSLASTEDIAFYNQEIATWRSKILEVKEETFNGMRLFSPDHNLLTASADTSLVNGAEETVSQFNLLLQNPPLPVEMIFLMDYSGSMGPYIQNVTNNVASFISSVQTRLSATTWSAKAVGYRGQAPSNHLFLAPDGGAFVSSVPALQNQLDQIRMSVGGGGTPGESLINGIEDALTVSGGWSDPSSRKVLMAFTDEPADPPQPGLTVSDVAGRIQSDNVNFWLFTDYPSSDPWTPRLITESGANTDTLATANSNMAAALDQIVNSLITTDLVDFDTINRCIAENVNQQSVIRNLIDSSELNLMAANSARAEISDLDVAAESIRLSRMNILNQAGAMVIYQTNVSASSVLNLLR